jgi:hypothetical protein
MVIQQLPGAIDGDACTRELVKERGAWVVRDKAGRKKD